MLKTALLLTSLLLVMLASLHAADVRDHVSPHQRAILESKSPSPAEYRFGFDLPAGPQFTGADKVAQRELGKGVMPMVMKAFESGAESVRIPPGDYRFGQERWQGAKVIFPLEFENMQRDAAHPFVIDASGATFWFDLDDKQMPPGHRCVGFRNCRNIVLRGAIIDRGTRGCIEGRITRIDREGNRFEIQPPPGFALESFDVIGGFRDRYRSLSSGGASINFNFASGWNPRIRLNQPVDPSGQLPGGEPFKNLTDFVSKIRAATKDQQTFYQASELQK